MRLSFLQKRSYDISAETRDAYQCATLIRSISTQNQPIIPNHPLNCLCQGGLFRKNFMCEHADRHRTTIVQSSQNAPFNGLKPSSAHKGIKIFIQGVIGLPEQVTEIAANETSGHL